MLKLSFFSSLPVYARQAALEEINKLLQDKGGQNFTFTEEDFTGVPAGNNTEKPRTFKEATKEEIDEVIKILM